MEIYQCRKCGKIVRNEKAPHNTATCEGNHLHQWAKIADEGNLTYECRKCGLTIERCKSQPMNIPTCEGNHLHQWMKL